MVAEKMTAITPTRNRASFLLTSYRLFKQQTYPYKEWLILDDSPSPCPFFMTLHDPEVRYFYDATVRSLGAKRNWLLAQATGTLVTHWDDDDWYHPNYLAYYAQALQEHTFVKAKSWQVYHPEAGFTGRASQRSHNDGDAGPHKPRLVYHPALDAVAPNQDPTYWQQHWDDPALYDISYGFSYGYRRQLGLEVPFDDITWGEDHEWALACFRHKRNLRLHHLENPGHWLTVHRLHRGNNSLCFMDDVAWLHHTATV